MGANPYWYFVPYEADFGAALQKLRAREFQAGRYNPVTPFQEFPIDPSAPTVGARHGSIEEVMEAADESKRQNGASVTLESVMAKAKAEAQKKLHDLK